MSIHATLFTRVFTFNFRARTSRGAMDDKTSWFIRLEDRRRPGVYGLGECGPLAGLSPEAGPDFEKRLASVLDDINAAGVERAEDITRWAPPSLSSIRFGLETAARDLAGGGRRVLFDNDFLQGGPIPINGLIWMGETDFMMEQIQQKVSAGFRCIKLKVGGLDFERECEVLSYIRKRYFREDLTLRLDANGAFKPADALRKLEALAEFRIHSIEQPLPVGAEATEEVCRRSPVPVALDEELIGVHTAAEKEALLARLKPQYIILKPTLHGGFEGAAEWIRLAEARGIGWWITSALESSIGLNAICQFTAQFDPTIPQGLGTGMIYENNFDSPLTVSDGRIYYDATKAWDASVGPS